MATSASASRDYAQTSSDEKKIIRKNRHGYLYDSELAFSAASSVAMRLNSAATGILALSATNSGAGGATISLTAQTAINLSAPTVNVGFNAGQTLNIASATGLIGFYAATPVVRPSSTGQSAGYTANSGTDTATFTGGSGTKAYTIGDIVRHLKALGLIASS